MTGIIRVRGGVRFHVNTASWVEWNLFFWGVYDAGLRDFLGQSTALDATAIDVGANVGVHTLALAQAAPDGRVIACEPSPAVVERLRANVALNGFTNITVEPVAVSDAPGAVTLVVPSEKESNQGTARVTRGPATPGSVTVPAITVDGLAESASLEQVDLIKIDVQGLDAAVMRGAARTLDRWRPLLVFEYDRAGWEEAGYELPATLRMLEDAGYQHFAALGAGGLARLGSGASESKNIVASAEPFAGPEF